MAPPKKRSGRRQRRNQADIGLVVTSPKAEDVPVPSAEWLDTTKERWRDYWGSQIAVVAERDSDMPALSRLYGYYDELERADRAFRAQRFVEGSQGQPRLNPLAKYMTELEGLIRQLEDRFGLTPKARLQLGVEFASAHRSLRELNDSFDETEEEADPRLEVIEGQAG